MTFDPPDPPESGNSVPSDPAGGAQTTALAALWRRLPSGVQRVLLAGGAAAGTLGLIYAALAGSPPPRAAARPAKAAKPAPFARLAAVQSSPVSTQEERALLIESIIRSQKKRIMGRKRSLADVARVATLVGPLVARALEQPAIQADLQVLAAQNGMSLAEYKRYFRHKQEADILLESGGDPNARSVSNAIGVAQFLAGTARGSGGLRVDLADSRRLTGRIMHAQVEIAALEALPENWTKPLPGARPAATAPHAALIAAAPAPAKEPASAGASAVNSSAHAPLASRGGDPDRTAALSTPAPASATDPAPPASAPPASNASAPSSSPPAAGAGPAAGGDQSALSPASDGTATKPAPTGDGAGPSPASSPAPASKPDPEPKKPVCPPLQPAAAAPAVITRDELIAKRMKEMRLLEAKRRQVDERYDPAKAIASQTRYLVRMARRYGSLDWVFQAYHGGEGGVRNTVSYYLGDRERLYGSPEDAIRGVRLASRGGGDPVHAPLTYEDLYFKTTPRAQPAAFSYLYGRSDDHRYYWWKILAAERAIDLYRRDPAEFRKEWRALWPGQRLEVVWYPHSKELDFHNVAALQQGYATGQLVHWPASARAHGLVLDNIAPLDPDHAFEYKGLRPEALGALFRLADLYMANGGASQPLRVVSLVETEQYRAQLNVLRPPSWMRRPTKPEDIPIDLEPTGLCFDIARPTAAWNRKVLEYALGWLADRNQIYWTTEWEQGPPRYHICPSPDYHRVMVRASR